MNTRNILQLIRSQALKEGAGVTVHRTIGTRALRHLDPFLMLDHFSSDNPQDYLAGFPEHPHRGFITLTYMLDGHMRHHDSMGNSGNLESGGAQWMKAASGVIHSEMPQQEQGLMRGFQLWINLPAADKMSDPSYQEIRPEAIPLAAQDGLKVHVLAGEFAGRQGPLADASTGLTYLDAALNAGRSLSLTLPAGHTALIYVFEGEGRIGQTHIPTHHAVVLGQGEGLEFEAGSDGARGLVIAGRPLGEPIMQYGPFVMNTREQIEEALEDLRTGHLVRKKAAVVAA